MGVILKRTREPPWRVRGRQSVRHASLLFLLFFIWTKEGEEPKTKSKSKTDQREKEPRGMCKRRCGGGAMTVWWLGGEGRQTQTPAHGVFFPPQVQTAACESAPSAEGSKTWPWTSPHLAKKGEGNGEVVEHSSITRKKRTKPFEDPLGTPWFCPEGRDYLAEPAALQFSSPGSFAPLVLPANCTFLPAEGRKDAWFESLQKYCRKKKTNSRPQTRRCCQLLRGCWLHFPVIQRKRCFNDSQTTNSKKNETFSSTSGYPGSVKSMARCWISAPASRSSDTCLAFSDCD